MVCDNIQHSSRLDLLFNISSVRSLLEVLPPNEASTKKNDRKSNFSSYLNFVSCGHADTECTPNWALLVECFLILNHLRYLDCNERTCKSTPVVCAPRATHLVFPKLENNYSLRSARKCYCYRYQ